MLAALITIVLYRRIWLTHKIAEYEACVAAYCLRTAQSINVVAEMEQLWPQATMLFEIWRWDFGRYVVYQNHYAALAVFVERELALTDTRGGYFGSDLDNRVPESQDKEDQNDPSRN